MGRDKHIGILGVAVAGLLTLGACGGRPTTLSQPGAVKHEYVQHIEAERIGFEVRCSDLPFSRC
jgi:hypothetical protein